MKPAYFWTADVTLEVKNLAFSLQTKDEGMGANRKRIFTADWIRDGKVMFNPAQRVSGWLKKQLPLLRSSYADQVQAVKTFPADDQELWEPIADANELEGVSTAPEDNMSYPEGIPFPNKTHIVVDDSKGGTRSTTTYWLTLNRPTIVQIRIMCFARSIEPDMIHEAFREIGQATGLGDKHSQGFGTFVVKKFKSETKRLKL
jgi:hypothetical protein